MRGVWQRFGTLAVMFGLLLPASTSDGAIERAIPESPRLASPVRADVHGAWARIEERGQLLPNVRLMSYGGHLRPPTLVADATDVVTRELAHYARAVVVTSAVRSPFEQRRLQVDPELRHFASQRSKHVMGGLAADIGIVKPRRSMRTLETLARAALIEHLGPEQAKKIRIVREPRVLHLEIDGKAAPEILEERVRTLEMLGILRPRRIREAVPPLRAYVPERSWLSRRGTRALVASAD